MGGVTSYGGEMWGNCEWSVHWFALAAHVDTIVTFLILLRSSEQKHLTVTAGRGMCSGCAVPGDCPMLQVVGGCASRGAAVLVTHHVSWNWM
jgi:hypothetical protein